MTTGLDDGAVAVPLLGMHGGFALSGRGPSWAWIVSRMGMVAFALVVVVGAFLAPFERRLAPTEPTGAYILLTFGVCCTLHAAACAIPHLPAHRAIADEHRSAHRSATPERTEQQNVPVRHGGV